jgi:hypothetical protein
MTVTVSYRSACAPIQGGFVWLIVSLQLEDGPVDKGAGGLVSFGEPGGDE